MGKFSHWAANSVFGLMMFGIACMLVSAMWVLGWYLDNKPPLVMTRYTVTPAYPGGTMVAVLDVQRDMTRTCRATYSTRFLDSAGVLHGIESGTPMTAKDIRRAEERNPGKSIFAMKVPYDAPAGKSKILTPILYYCNPWQTISNNPLEVSLELDALVLAR